MGFNSAFKGLTLWDKRVSTTDTGKTKPHCEHHRGNKSATSLPLHVNLSSPHGVLLTESCAVWFVLPLLQTLLRTAK